MENIQETPQTIPTIQPTPPSAPLVKPPLIGKPTLMICAILILVTTIAILFIRSQQKIIDDIYQPSPNSNPTFLTPTLTTDQSSETSTHDSKNNWKNYNNENLGISFDYPSSYKILSENDHSVDMLSPNPNPNISAGDLRITIEKELVGKNRTLEQFIENRLGQDSKIDHRSEVIVGGFNAIEVQSQSLNTGDEGIDFFIIKGDYFYVISKAPLETSRQNEFDQILSTFRFISTPHVTKFEDESKIPKEIIDSVRKYYPDKDYYPQFNNSILYGSNYIEVSVQSKYPSGFAVGLIKRPKGWVKIWAGQDRPACSTLELHLAPEGIECARPEIDGFDKTHFPIDTIDVEMFLKNGLGLRDGDVISTQIVEGDNAYGNVTTAEGYSSYWAAGKIDGKWSYGFGGNGIPSCTEVEEFPIDVFGGKFDSCSLDDGQIFNRKTNTPVK